MSGLQETLLLVPQGAEYSAVSKGAGRGAAASTGASHGQTPRWTVVPIAMGQSAIAQIEPLLAKPPARAILLGLGGSLSLDAVPGAVVVYRDCVDQLSGQRLSCDRPLRTALFESLSACETLTTTEATGLTSDRVICAAAEKRRLGERYGAAVVDMEGYPVLALLQQQGIAAAVVRVVSDGAEGDIPDLGEALGKDGSLRPFALASALGRSPRAALRLIKGSLRGLSVLQRVAAQISAL